MACGMPSTRASAATPASRARSSLRRAAPHRVRARADAISSGGTLRVAQAADIASLDPWTASDPATLTVLRQVYETLVDLEPGGFRVVPRLAERWTVSADGRVWIFQLRQGVRFHDGTAL